MVDSAFWAQSCNKATVLAKFEYLTDVQLLPFGRLDPEGWLGNFRDDEQEYALHLLNSFCFISDALVHQLFAAGLVNLRREVVLAHLDTPAKWTPFIQNARFLCVEGERPNPADSGHIFVRLARDVLGAPENNILDYPSAIACLLAHPDTPMVFVDDFVGSGNQFITSWLRKHKVPGKKRLLSFAEAASMAKAPTVFYCPLVCTRRGYDEIVKFCPGVALRPTHVIDNDYSALHPYSRIWPPHLRGSATTFLERASKRAGIRDRNGRVGDWRGFHKLGLAVAFEHCTPDATLPLFTWRQNDWRPLL